jgi:predicted O-methyltransferase YrrM
MSIRRALGRVPLAVEIKRRASVVAGAPTRRRVVRQLRESGHAAGTRISQAVDSHRRPLPEPGQEWVRRIEGERNRLIGLDDPLVDGSLGDGGPFDAGLTISDVGYLGMEPRKARLLYLLVRALEPKTVVELGTAVGISTAYIGAALQRGDNGATLVTHDASPYRLRLARAVHNAVGLDDITYVEGLIADTLPATLARVGSADLVCTFADYQCEPMLGYLEDMLACSAPDAVFVFDGIHGAEGMRQAWSAIRTDERLGLVVDLHSFGIGARGDGVNRRLVPDRVRVH